LEVGPDSEDNRRMTYLGFSMSPAGGTRSRKWGKGRT